MSFWTKKTRSRLQVASLFKFCQEPRKKKSLVLKNASKKCQLSQPFWKATTISKPSSKQSTVTKPTSVFPKKKSVSNVTAAKIAL